MNNTIIDDNYPIYSIQYIIISGYVIISWGKDNFISYLSKLLFIYLNLSQ